MAKKLTFSVIKTGSPKRAKSTPIQPQFTIPTSPFKMGAPISVMVRANFLIFEPRLAT